jgi:hypothetical protein
MDRHRTPAQAFQAAPLRLGLDNFARRVFLAWRHKNHAQPEDRGQFDSGLTRVLADQPVWDTSQQTCAVTASSIGIHTSAMRQADQRFEGTIHDLARSRTVDSGDQADTAGVVVCG